MKRTTFIMVLILILTVSLFSGCVKSQKPLPKVDDNEKQEGADKTPGQGITVNEIKYEVIDINALSEQMVSSIEILRQSRGYEIWEQEDGSFLILISAGEKPSGGYAIEVDYIEDNEGKTVISVRETEPGPNDAVTLAITYPIVLVKASGITNDFVVRDQNQIEYQRARLRGDDTNAAGGTMLNQDENPIDFSKPIIGVYQGRIDNNSIEVVVGEIPIALFSYDMDKHLEGINEGDTIEAKVSISPSDQIIVEELIKQ